jgi:tRNA pseudouridine55 synthase
LDRVLIVDKPSGITSHDVVARVRRALGTRRVGHAGTLDPLATGVLVVLVGKATRLSAFLMDTTKRYAGRIVLGVSTDTQDAEGRVLSRRPVAGIDIDDVRRVFEEFTGVIEQVPPMTSALKRDGTPLYELARKGVEVKREPRRVTIESFEVLAYEPPEIEFDMVCSRGTYVRTVAADVGERLGCGAHLGELRRTRVGRFAMEEAVPLSDIESLGEDPPEAGHSMYDALSDWEVVRLDDPEAERVMCGGTLEVTGDRLGRAREGDHVRLTVDGERLLAVGLVATATSEDGLSRVRPVRVFETLP